MPLNRGSACWPVVDEMDIDRGPELARLDLFHLFGGLCSEQPKHLSCRIRVHCVRERRPPALFAVAVRVNWLTKRSAPSTSSTDLSSLPSGVSRISQVDELLHHPVDVLYCICADADEHQNPLADLADRPPLHPDTTCLNPLDYRFHGLWGRRSFSSLLISTFIH